MAYNSRFAWNQNPTMRGARALNPRTMVTPIPTTHLRENSPWRTIVSYVSTEELPLEDTISTQIPNADRVVVEIPIVIDAEFEDLNTPDSDISGIPT